MNYPKENMVCRCRGGGIVCGECHKESDKFSKVGPYPYHTGPPLACLACGKMIHSIQGEADAVCTSGDN